MPRTGVKPVGRAVNYPEEVPGGAARGLLAPRWLGLLAALVVLVAACIVLGLWQLGVARDQGRKEVVAAAGAQPRAPLSQVVAPHTPFAGELSNRRVTATGRYAAGRGLVVVDRRLGDRVGSWLVTPLETPEGTVAVLRGFVESGEEAGLPGPPAGEVTVLGTLGPGESPRAGDPLPEGQRRSVDLSQLVNEWPGDLYNVVLLASDEVTADGTPVPSTGLTRVPPPDVEAPLNLRNAAYAVQWWVFALFFVWMWWKMYRTEHSDQADRSADAPHPSDNRRDDKEGVPA